MAQQEAVELPTFEPKRPCYLGNTLGLAPDKNSSFVVLGGLLPSPPTYNLSDPLPIMRPPCCSNTSYYDVNGLGPLSISMQLRRSAPKFDFEVKAGSLWDLDYYAPQLHPAHYHMFHFQIVDLPELGAHSNYWQVGDYHDTLHLTIPDSGYYGKVKIRVNVATITGRFLAHCHFYRHTDRGMAYEGVVTGEDGVYSSQLSNCYDSLETRGVFSDPTPSPVSNGNDGGEDLTTSMDEELTSGDESSGVPRVLSAETLSLMGIMALFL